MNEPDAMTNPIPAEERAARDEISLAAAGATLLRGRRILLLSIFLGGVVGVLIARSSGPSYRASATFITAGAASQPQTLAGLAGQFGLAIPGRESNQSPEFYQTLLTTREVLESVAIRSYSVPSDDSMLTSRPLLEIVQAEGTSDAERLANGIDWLKNSLVSSVNRQTGVVSLSVQSRWPTLSEALTSTLLEALQTFDLETRRTQAQAERDFLQERLSAAKDQLAVAEQALQSFLQQNRQFFNAPELQFQHDRLQREVNMRQQVYAGLMDAYEQASIRAVRDTPVLTVLEHPIVPPFREARRTILKGLIGMSVGLVAGLVVILMHAQTRGHQDPDVESLRDEWEKTKSDLRRLLLQRRTA
jgi:uncharacterized protein involved in exopolysaccharide biosynthesis